MYHNSPEDLYRLSQDILDSGNLATGDYEAIEVYYGLVMNAATALIGLIVAMQTTLIT